MGVFMLQEYTEFYCIIIDVYNDGKLRAIGDTNFLYDVFIELLDRVKVIPAVNQVETHLSRQRSSLKKLPSKAGTVMNRDYLLRVGKIVSSRITFCVK